MEPERYRTAGCLPRIGLTLLCREGGIRCTHLVMFTTKRSSRLQKTDGKPMALRPCPSSVQHQKLPCTPSLAAKSLGAPVTRFR